MRLEDLAFFAQPMGARPVVGARTELGFPVYQDVGGNQFSVMPQAQSEGEGWSFGGVMNALAAPYRLARGMGSDQDAAAMQGVAGAMTQGLLAPGRALQGEPVTYGDAWSTALDYGLLGAPMAAPDGAIRAGSLRTAAEIESAIRQAFPEVKLSISGTPQTGVTISRIEVPASMRGQGIGSDIMRQITDFADAAGAQVNLTPSADFGGNVSRLRDFYSRFGFVDNTGRARDFSTRETMYRTPK